MNQRMLTQVEAPSSAHHFDLDLLTELEPGINGRQLRWHREAAAIYAQHDVACLQAETVAQASGVHVYND